MIDLGKITQGERGTITFTWEFPDGLTSPATIMGATITAVCKNLDTGDVTIITGTLTGTAATTVTWALSAGDSGTAGTYALVFRAVVSGTATYTLDAALDVQVNPSATATQNPPLVGVSADEAAWLTVSEAGGALGAAAYADTGDFDAAGAAAARVAKAGDTMTGALILSGAPVVDLQAATKKYVDDNAGGVSDVDDLTTTTGTATHMVRVAAAGGLEYRTPANVRSDIGAEAVGVAAALVDDLSGVTDVEAARTKLVLADMHVMPIMRNHTGLTFASTDVVGSAEVFLTSNGLFDLRSGGTANSQVRYRVASDGININNLCHEFANWTRRIVCSGQIKYCQNTTGMTNYFIFGKASAAGFGKIASGDYVGVTFTGNELTEGFVCKSGTLVSVAFTPVARTGDGGLHWQIVSENGTVNFYANGNLVGTTAAGPVNNNAGGTYNIELISTTTASIMQCITQSEGW